MERKEYEALFRLEKDYWWLVGQRFLLGNLLKKNYSIKNNKSGKKPRILDVGCGTGLNLKLINCFGEGFGVDIAEEAVEFCRRRRLAIKKADVMNLPYPKESFEAVTALAVFYHKKVADDVQGMREVYRVLKKKGRFFFFDSAMKCLYGKHDIAFHSIRRYAKKELRAKLQKAGFKVERISYYNTLFFPLVYLKKKIERLSAATPKSELDKEIYPWLNKILTEIYKAEISGLRYIDYPFGVNIFAVAKKV